MRDAPDRSVAQYVFFIDRGLGSIVVPETLRQAGVHVEIHASHFADNTPDTVWLSDVGQQGWIVLMKDKHIRSRPHERQALIYAGGARICPCSRKHFRARDGSKFRQRPSSYVRPFDTARYAFYCSDNTARTNFHYPSP